MPEKETREVSEGTVRRIKELQSQLKGEAVSQLVLNKFSPKERKDGEKLTRQFNKQRKKAAEQRGEASHEYRPCLPHGIDLYSRVRHLPPVVATLDLAYQRRHIDHLEYNDLRIEYGVDQFDNGIELRKAMEVADLVVAEYHNLVVWKKREIEFPSENLQWCYFVRLTHSACSSRSIGPEDFYRKTTFKQLTDWKNRLGSMTGFPRDLLEKIHASDGRHRLNVPKNKIRVLLRKQPGALT